MTCADHSDSAPCSPESAAWTSGSSVPDGSALGKLNVTSSVNVSSPSTGPTFLATETSATSPEPNSRPSISSAVDSLASPSVWLDDDEESMTNVGSGLSSPDLSPSSGRGLSSSRTSQDSYIHAPTRRPSIDAYAAGLVDGEGCIYVTRRGRAFSAWIDVGMTEKARPVLVKLLNAYGGTVNAGRPATARWEATLRWRTWGSTAAHTLELLLPHLVLKPEQARLAIRVEAIRAEATRPSGRTTWTDEMVRRCEAVRLEIQNLNRKGPAEIEPPGWIARHVGGTWVTSQRDLFSDLGYQMFSGTWPSSGSMRNGRVYQRPPLVPRTSATGSSSWPTPVASDAGKDRGSSAGWGLRDAVRRLRWPTPNARDHKDTGANVDYKRVAARSKLAGAVMTRTPWPTPTSSRRDGLQSHGKNAITGALNPTWVEWLMGFPLGWTDCGPSATRSSRKSRNGSAND
jgi:hypothetical protein